MQELPAQSGIYRITCLANGEFYVGSAVNMRKRQYKHLWHLRHNSHGNYRLQKIYNEHGAQLFIFDVLEYCNRERLIECEQYYIDTLNPEINILKIAGDTKTKSAGSIRVVTEETRRKISEGNKGKKLSASHIEKLKARKGMTFSDIWKSRISVSGKGRVQGLETRKKISNANAGRRFNENSRQKMSEAQRGKTRSEETRRKITESLKARNRNNVENYDNWAISHIEAYKRGNLSIREYCALYNLTKGTFDYWRRKYRNWF